MPEMTPLEAAEQLEKIAKHDPCLPGNDYTDALLLAASYLRRIAAGEIRPVVHAKSVFVNNGKIERWCSRCNHIIPKYAEWCPFCGALMEDSND